MHKYLLDSVLWFHFLFYMTAMALISREPESHICHPHIKCSVHLLTFAVVFARTKETSNLMELLDILASILSSDYLPPATKKTEYQECADR